MGVSPDLIGELSMSTPDSIPPMVVSSKKLKVVICGSFKDITGIMRLRQFLLSLLGPSFEVYPTPEHIEESRPLIAIHHYGEGEETEESYQLRQRVMEMYFNAIRSCDVLFIYNLKEGKEHIGSGTLMEIGFTHSLGKPVWFLLRPRDDNVLSMWGGNPTYLLDVVINIPER